MRNPLLYTCSNSKNPTPPRREKKYFFENKIHSTRNAIPTTPARFMGRFSCSCLFHSLPCQAWLKPKSESPVDKCKKTHIYAWTLLRLMIKNSLITELLFIP
jgi:hypothetical protein